MITCAAENCGKVLYSLNIPESDIIESERLWNVSAQLREALCCPAVSLREKYSVIDKLFPTSVGAFLKVICGFGHIDALSEIFEAYKELMLKSRGIVKAVLYCAKAPDKETEKKFREMLCRKYGADGAELEICTDSSLIGGYRLCVGDTEYDKSVAGALKALHKKLAEG
ncbi:hypothetical protein Osc1_16130 [Hominimerdicola sp. 21CYCFAH17_S]